MEVNLWLHKTTRVMSSTDPGEVFTSMEKKTRLTVARCLHARGRWRDIDAGFQDITHPNTHALRHPASIKSAIRADMTRRSFSIQEELVHLSNVLNRYFVSADQTS